MIDVASIYIRKRGAFLPTYAHIKGGPYFGTEPIYTSDLTLKSLTNSIEKLIKAGHTQVTPSSMNLRYYKSPLLKIVGVRSWKKLTQESVLYTVRWKDDEILLHLHALDKKGRFYSDPDRTVTFPKTTPPSRIVQAILGDIEKLPSLGYINPT